MIKKQFVLFLIAGGVAALANLGSRVVFSRIMDYVPAVVTAYCIGMIVAFLLNRLFVFENIANSVQQQAFWFTVINLLAVLQTVAISWFLARHVLPYTPLRQYGELIAHFVGVIVPVFTSYIGHKTLSFRKT